MSLEGLGAGVELEVRALNLHQAQLPFRVVWDALGEQLMVSAVIMHHGHCIVHCMSLLPFS